MLFFSFNYWIQCNRNFGPLSTTVTKVIKDVGNVGFAYIVFYLAFVFGIHLVLSTETSRTNVKGKCAEDEVL